MKGVPSIMESMSGSMSRTQSTYEHEEFEHEVECDHEGGFLQNVSQMPWFACAHIPPSSIEDS